MVLILEDDIRLADGFDSKLEEALKWVPEFDMLFLNGTLGKHQKPEKINECIYKVLEMYGAFGYIVHQRFYQTLINELEINKGMLSTDAVYCKLMTSANIFRLVHPIVFHRPGFSDRTERIEKGYKHLEK